MSVEGGRDWLTAAEIVAIGAPDLPGSVRGFNDLAAASGWRKDETKARRLAQKGGGWEYHISVLPPSAQMRLALRRRAAPTEAAAPRDEAAWAGYEALPAKAKAEAERRLAILDTVETLAALSPGRGMRAAIQRAAVQHGVSVRSIDNWRAAAGSACGADRLPLLAPQWKSAATFDPCHSKALDILISDWLRPERPAFSACYRRMRKAASANGWLPIPSERALRRRVEAEVPRAVATLARDGKDKAKTLYPVQRRSRMVFHAMQAVNMDGHKLDVRVSVPWAKDPQRMHLIALQDLYSGKIVAWRVTDSENRHSVRLTIGDMISAQGIPEQIYLDNGRAFTSKDISGGAQNRFRFKIREDDPQGLLTSLGVQIHWTKPYSGQSKPIERAFRDLCEEIAKHPACSGAYTGNDPLNKPANYGTRAVALDALKRLVDEMIAEHNARPGRRTETAGGRSFDETFEASLADPANIVTRASEAQRSLWLLTADRVTAQRGSGEIKIFGNRYWATELNQYAGRKVTVRFDPERLHEPLIVYDQTDRLICRAACIADTGFNSAEAATTHNRNRAAYERALREHERLRDKLSADELAGIYGAVPSEKPKKAVRSKVVRLAGARGGAAAAPAPDESFDFQEALERGLRLVASRDD
jgi:putative transposase